MTLVLAIAFTTLIFIMDYYEIKDVNSRIRKAN